MTPVLWSFRRCPYAIRARLAVAASGVSVELRDIELRDKPAAFVQASPSGTVPCLAMPDGVIDESLDIMRWALRLNDPLGWLDMPEAGMAWIARCDGPFKHSLDRTKYENRYPDEDPLIHRATASAFLSDLNAQLDGWIYGRATLADMAILPFIRQFAYIDKAWFDAQPWPALQDWLARFLASSEFAQVMHKQAVWSPGQPPVSFP